MAVGTARFAHCQFRRPVLYRTKSPFRPRISAPLDFSVRAGEVYTLDHELDRAVLGRDDFARLLEEDAVGYPGPGGGFPGDESSANASAGGLKSAAQEAGRIRRLLVHNELRLSEESARFRPPWTAGLLQEAQAELLRGLEGPGHPGELRTEPVVLHDLDGSTTFTACPPDRIVRDLEEVLEWVDQYGATYHPLVPATVLFEALFAIRPFRVGNAAVALTMSVQYLRFGGLRNVELTPVGRAMMASPALTLRLLLWTEASGSYSEFLDYILDSVHHGYAEANLRWVRAADASGRLEEVAIRLLARARREAGWFSAGEARRWVGARSDQTVLRHLNVLVRRGILESLGQTRGKRFRVRPQRPADPRQDGESSPTADTSTPVRRARARRLATPPSSGPRQD